MKRLHIYILIVLCLSNFKVVWANNGAGAELIYEYVNDSTYRFWYKFYTACGAFPEANDVSLCYRNSCTNIWYTERIAKASLTPWGTPNGQMVVLPCGDQPTRCTDPASTLNMYREWWYTGLVTLNQRCDTWTFSVNRERTQDISNVLIMPILEHNIYVEATINTLTERRQSSPYFTSPLPVYACAGSPFNYNLGVVDPDGDSLVFKTIIPRTATWDITVVCAGYPPSNMTYSGMQYNINNNPLDANNTYNLNSATGDVSFTPAGNQVAFLAFLVEKYRNGKLIGTVMRDSRLEVRDCNAPPV